MIVMSTDSGVGRWVAVGDSVGVRRQELLDVATKTIPDPF